MPDNPEVEGKEWGCINIPFVGRYCASDAVEFVKGEVSEDIQNWAEDAWKPGQGESGNGSWLIDYQAGFLPTNGGSMPDNPYIPNWIEGMYNPDVNGNGNGPAVQPGGGGPMDGAHAHGKGCCPTQLYAQVQATQRRSCPRGYVLVNHPSTGQAACMLRGEAVKCGLWRAARKPPIKASDYRCLMKSASVIKKMDRIVAATNKITGKNRMSRSK